MSTNFKPLGNNLVVEPMEQESRTALGIVLPETAKEKPQTGLVVAVGPGRKDDKGELVPMELKEGDKVLFVEEAGKVYILNASLEALKEAQAAFVGEAERAGLKNEDDIVAMIKQFRRERTVK
jgi:co-chaperonin GroES (HSP10)